MKVSVYVEGPSDKSAMKTLLRPLVEEKQQQGVDIQFYETPNGDRKTAVLTKVPKKAVNILRSKPHDYVVALPDLYPRNKGFPHETVDELVQGVMENFRRALQAKGAEDSPRVAECFRVFCFKYDLEALLLASEEGLKRQLGAAKFKTRWRVPVEDQDHDRPPKRIVEELFNEHGKRYRNTVDAPLVLGASNYQDLAARCPQCFGPFVRFLTDL